MSARGLALASLVLIPAAATAQTIDRMVNGAGDGTVQFHFAAREGVCGNGRNFYRFSEGGNYSNYNNGLGADDTCARGPVRVVLVRAGREIIRIETYAGPLNQDAEAGRDLGAVSARDAATYLVGLAATLDGRPAREALTPAMLADSAVVTPQLLQLVRDQNRSRDVRSSAIGWLARRRNESLGAGTTAVTGALDAIVRDHNESETIRQQALSTIGSLDRGEGIPMLVAFANDKDQWVARQAFSSLAQSGDPRARQFVRDALRRNDLPDEVRATAIRGVGNSYATSADFRLLRDLYPNVNTDQERNAIINAIANAGGSDNINWLLTLARSPTETPARRHQAISALSRNDDPRIKDALKDLVVR